ncbi:uncharacterized protein [Phyllobates terribilis]|uniref:uncharacterized protein isoform X2 n=1 Tax=Phyllobates terribilis TaxID=111132 RepID=UPI003CCB2C19
MKVNMMLMLVILALNSRVQATYIQPHEHTARIRSSSTVTASCTTTARDLPGSSADVFCPADCSTSGRSVWGTDVYTDDSSICRAAIHAGKIPNEGGQVSVQKTPGQTSYNGSTRNGIKTKNYGSFPGSFIFVASTSPVTPEPTKEITQTPPVTASCSTTARDLPGSSADVFCPADCSTSGRSVWGTDVYTDDSSICRAAIHAGKIPNEGGQVSVQKTPGQASYNGSTRNGIKTKNYGSFPGSFIFVASTSPVTPEPTKEITQTPPVTASCSTTARDLPGSSADVFCPADCSTSGRSVWGTDVYTDDSSICRAAIHAGKIPNEGGQVSVQKTPGQTSYNGSTRNGIKTKNYGSFPGSFIFVASTSPVTPEPTKEITQTPPVTASCTTTARDLPGSSADVFCPADCSISGRSVWGTDVYTDDSSICRAAIHAGKIPNEGGQVSVQKTPGQASYNGSTRNGIKTKNYGSYPGSFIFVASTSPVTPEPTKEITQTPPVTASCSTTARDLPGSSADVFCPADCSTSRRSVWGTDVYTDDSSICRAAIHAGKIPNEGGQVSVQKTPGQDSYNGSTRNGITTKNYGSFPGSFIFVVSTSPVTPEPTREITQTPPVTASCSTTARDLPGSSADVFCPADCSTSGRSVWGTDVYTDDSSICRAAIHAGKIPNEGGQVSVQKTPGQASYNGSTRNGIKTKNYGSFPGSFIFVASTSPVTPEPTREITQTPPEGKVSRLDDHCSRLPACSISDCSVCEETLCNFSCSDSIFYNNCRGHNRILCKCSSDSGTNKRSNTKTSSDSIFYNCRGHNRILCKCSSDSGTNKRSNTKTSSDSIFYNNCRGHNRILCKCSSDSGTNKRSNTKTSSTSLLFNYCKTLSRVIHRCPMPTWLPWK